MDVTRHDQTDLRVLHHHVAHHLAALQPHAIHPPDAGLERRLVDGDHRGPLGVFAQLEVEPLRIGGLEAVLTGVEKHDPVVPEVDRAVAAQLIDRTIVVARDRLPPGPQRRQPLTELGPLLRRSGFGEIPGAFGQIIDGAFNADAARGGFLGVLVIGFQRAAFSNEAGAGSASIAHSAAKTEEPVREGIVALLEPFIDTVVVCTMTALVIVITGAWNSDAPEFVAARAAGGGSGGSGGGGGNGATRTSLKLLWTEFAPAGKGMRMMASLRGSWDSRLSNNGFRSSVGLMAMPDVEPGVSIPSTYSEG